MRDAPGSISLQISASCDSGIVVQKINMRVGAYQIIGDKDDLLLKADGGSQIRCGGMIADNCRVGFSLG